MNTDNVDDEANGHIRLTRILAPLFIVFIYTPGRARLIGVRLTRDHKYSARLRWACERRGLFVRTLWV